MSYNQTGGRLSNKTIERMAEGGASSAEVRYARESQHSMDVRDVSRHREFINQYNGGDPWREPNNYVMHPNSYHFGTGHQSPQYIGGMFAQHGQPIMIAGPQFAVNPHIAPYVQFGYL